MTKMMPTPRALSWRIMPKSFSTSGLVERRRGLVEDEDLAVHVHRAAMATICCMAMEQLPSCSWR